MLIGCSWDRKGSCKEFNGKRGSRNIKNKIGRKRGFFFFKGERVTIIKNERFFYFCQFQQNPQENSLLWRLILKHVSVSNQVLNLALFFSDAGLQLENSNLLFGLMNVLSPALHYLALLRGGWSSKGYIIYKALWDRAGRKTLLLITYPFFSPDHFINVGNFFFFLKYNLNSNSLFLHLNNMISPHLKDFPI